MIRKLLRLAVGLNVYAIGLFWTWLALLRISFTAISRGKNGIIKLFSKKKHTSRPEVASVGFEHNYVRTKSGLRFHYVHKGSSSQPLMLCLHGFPECWYSWKNILKRFGSDYYVVAIDMRGYGDSDKPNSVSPYHIDYLTNDVKEIIYALDYKEAVLVGHDWGGVVAFQVAHVYPEMVSKLIVMNASSLNAYFSYVLFHPKQLLMSWYAFLYQVPFIPEWLVSIDDYKPITHYFKGRGEMGMKNSNSCLTDEEIEVYKNASSVHIHYGINYYRAINPIYQGLNLKKRNETISKPTLLIWGSEDKAMEIGLVDHMKNYVENLKSEIIEGASHWVALDEPERVIKAMSSFLGAS